MSENLLATYNLSDIYKTLADTPNAVNSDIWDDLLAGIAKIINDMLNTAIGAGGKSINDLINSVKTKIEGITTSVTNAVTGVVGGIKDSISGIVKDVSGFIDTAVTNIGTTLNGAIGSVIDAVNGVTDSVVTAVSGLVDGISDAISNALAWISEKLQGVIDSISDIGDAIGQWISTAINNVGTWINNAITDVYTAVATFITNSQDTVAGWINDAIVAVKDAIMNVYNNVAEWINGAIDTVRTAIENVVQGITDTYNSVAKGVVEWISEAILWVNTTKDNIVAFFWKTLTDLGAWFVKNVVPKFDNAVAGASALYNLAGTAWGFISKGDYQSAFNLLDNFAKEAGIPAPVNTIHSLVSAIAYFYETVHLQFVPMEVAAQKRAVIGLALEPISDNDAAAAVYKGLWGESDYINNASLAGVSATRSKVSLEANKPLPSPGQAQQLFLRGEIDENQHDKILASYGFSSQYIKEIKSLYAVIPPLNDIITMAVKEAFTPEIATRFGQYEDLPEVFISWAKKQGLSEDWAGRYWASHWQLPSPQMGFQMYQRGIVDKDDLTLLLKALDVMPFWREKLIDLAYNPPTRVDVRRMYKIGLIDEDQVYKFHLDIGYSPENARMLTEFTKRYSAPEDTSQADEFAELARSTYSNAYKKHIISMDEYTAFLSGLKYADEDIALLITLDDYAIAQSEALFDLISYRNDYVKLITQGYNRGLFNREDTKPMLAEMGFTEDQAELELGLLDYNRQLSTRDTLVNQLHNQYVKFIIDNVELHSVMDTFGFYPDEVDRLVSDWDIERSFRDNRPSQTEVKKFFDKGLIDKDMYLNELRGFGYHEKYIDLYNQTLEGK